jgi:hypothetical protein
VETAKLCLRNAPKPSTEELRRDESNEEVRRSYSKYLREDGRNMRSQTRRRDTNPQVETAKLCLRDAPKPKTENFLISKCEEDEHNVSSEEIYARSNWKSDGEGNATMENCDIAGWSSKRVQQRRTLYDVTVKSPRNPKRDGKPARAGGRCLVTMPSRPDRDRKFGGRVGPAGTCGRGGADWYPSQYPTPAGLKASDDWDGCHDGGGSRPGSARRPVWCTARAGSVPAAGPGTVEARRSSRLGRVRPGRGPGHSGSEEEQPTGPSPARPRARAQWKRGGAAD